jgi:4-alpha-glucanotransferase
MIPAPFERAAGILLHPTSLPGRFGIGDLGPAAERFVEFVSGAALKLWQVLPLGPTGYGDSPYQSFSTFAGNPYLVSPEHLFADGLLGRDDLDRVPPFPEGEVDYGPVIRCKLALLDRAWERFGAGAAPAMREPFESYRHQHEAWLDDYALFMALKEVHHGAVWNTWDETLAKRETGALESARTRLADSISSWCFRQFLFDRQWAAVRGRAHHEGIRVVGDIPIFVAFDSADVWAHPRLYHLGPDLAPTVVAGVPPDYFSATGQLWGNPLYRWEAHQRDGFAWWIARMRSTLSRVDLVRLDHFRGFEAYWEVPFGESTAERGRWVKAPGEGLLARLTETLGELPVIAEDLGVITPEVVALRERFGLPGMKILQFAFSSDGRDHSLPHTYRHDCVVYSGTHDNDTTRGWYERSSTERERDFARRYLGSDGHDIAWDLIRLAFASVADTAVVPLQDVLDLGTEARMNLPARPDGNWKWRFGAEQLTDAHRDRLAELVKLYGR